MAVVVTKNPSSIKIKYDCGKDPVTQKLITKTKSYGHVVPGSLDEDCYDVASAIASMQTNTLDSVSKIDNSQLSE